MSAVRIVLLFSFLLTSIGAFAQEIDNINPLIKIIAGEAFYVHEVKQGQDLDEIARAYAARVSDIEAENPSLTYPLIVGINIRIPYTDESAARMMEVAEEMYSIESAEERARKERERNEELKRQAAAILPSKLATAEKMEAT
jgi:glycine cleavage system protein P-like pyridoxal-binding family